MENKRYLDKIIGSLVRSTKIDYEKGIIYFPFSIPSSSNFFFSSLLLLSTSTPSFFFSDYCENQFGLTEEEIEYVWNKYKSIIKDKIKNGR